MATSYKRVGFNKDAKKKALERSYNKLCYGFTASILTLLVANSACVSTKMLTSVSTPITSKWCSKPIDSIVTVLTESADFALECPAPNGWRLFIIGTEDRSWIGIAKGRSYWTTEDEVIQPDRNYFGDGPSVMGGESVEWRISKSNTPNALIFSVFAQDPKSAAPAQLHTISRFFVVDLTTGAARFCGMVKTRKEAIAKGDYPAACTTPLEKHVLP
jgi:hypothetical protein